MIGLGIVEEGLSGCRSFSFESLGGFLFLGTYLIGFWKNFFYKYIKILDNKS